jgi:hypothetical protein
MRATAALEDPSDPKRELGLGMRKAHKILDGVIDQIDCVDKDELIIKRPFSNLERRVFDFYSTRMIIQTASTEERLCRELGEVLVRNQVIDSSDVCKVSDQSQFLAVYAMSKMHLCEVSYQHRPKVTLQLAVDVTTAKLQVSGFAKIEPQDPVDVMVRIFMSDCDAREWCAPGLISSPEAFTRPVELNDEGLLVPL